jgi:hypothetical protein
MPRRAFNRIVSDMYADKLKSLDSANVSLPDFVVRPSSDPLLTPPPQV